MSGPCNQRQTWRDAAHGSRARALAPGRLSAPAAEQGDGHMAVFGSLHKWTAAAAGAGFGDAPSSVPSIPIAGGFGRTTRRRRARTLSSLDVGSVAIPIARGVPASERCRRVPGAARSNGGRRSVCLRNAGQVATFNPEHFQSLPAGGRSRIGACAAVVRRQPGARGSACGRHTPAMLRTRHFISAALLTSCGRSKPSDVDACFPEPFIEPSHHIQRLSSVASFEKQLSERHLEPCSRNRGMSYPR